MSIRRKRWLHALGQNMACWTHSSPLCWSYMFHATVTPHSHVLGLYKMHTGVETMRACCKTEGPPHRSRHEFSSCCHRCFSSITSPHPYEHSVFLLIHRAQWA